MLKIHEIMDQIDTGKGGVFVSALKDKLLH